MKSKVLIILSIVFVFCSLKAQIPTNGLVLNLPLDGNVNDSSSYKNNGVNHGAIPIADRTGKAGKAMYFNGTSSIEIPNSSSLDLTTNKTLACWIYIPSNVYQNLYPTLIKKEEPIYSATYNLQLNETSSYTSDYRYKLDFYFASGSTHYQIKSKQLYTNFKDKWLHIVATYDTISGYSKMYFNGVLSDSSFIGKKIANSSTSPVRIGCGSGVESYYNYNTSFNGSIDDVLLYNRALSAKEVNQIYSEKFIVNAGADKTIVCSDTVKLDSVKTTYSGNGVLRYKWTPSTGLNNDTIARPTCTTINNITYTVKVITPEGSTASDRVNVSVSFSPINTSTIYKYITCGQSVKFDSTKTNYTGTKALKYKWSPSKGLDNDTIASPTCTISQSTNYSVTITAPGGCSTTGNVNVSVYSDYSYLNINKTVSCGDTIKLSVPTTGLNDKGILKYKWTPATGLNSDTIAYPIAKLTSNMVYSYTVTTSLGCTAATGYVYITFTKTNKPEISGVGVDSNNKNSIMWNKSLYSNANTFNIYKETNIADSYSKIGMVSYDSASIFVDTLSFPKVQSNRYKLTFVDKCGYETDLSDYHKTMHLAINQGVNNSWNLIWESYEGFTVSTYNIYRGTEVNNIELVGTLSGNNNQFSDFTPPVGNVYYQIEAVKSAPTTVTSSIQNTKSTTAGPFTSSRSNIATNVTAGTGLNSLKDISNMISIYPNPTSDKVELNIDENIYSGSIVSVYNMLGSIVKSEKVITNKQIIELGNLTNGVYLLVVKSDKFTGSQRLIIQKK